MLGLGGSAAVAARSPYFRITGGVVWTRPHEGPIATRAEDGWRHKEVPWPGMRFEGHCRFVFGLPRDPTRISEPLQSVSIFNHVLSANGIPVAVYDDAREIWHGVTADSWWPAFRIEIAELRNLRPKPTLRGDVIHSSERADNPSSGLPRD